MSRVRWNTMELAGTIESSWMLFKDLFFSAIDSVVSKVQWKKSKMKHWFSCDTIHLIYKKRHMYQHLQKFQRLRHSPPPELLAVYRKLSNRVCFLTRLDSHNYAESLSKQYSSNPKKFWSWLNSSRVKGILFPY